MRRVACVRLPHWPLQRWHAARKDSLSPWVVLYGPSAATQIRRGDGVVACSRAAWKCGVRAGMPLAEALALVRRDASRRARSGATGGGTGGGRQVLVEPIVERHDAAADWEALRGLATQCESFSPLVGWETLGGETRGGETRGGETRGGASERSQPGLSPAHLWLDITGIGPLFGGEPEWVRQMRAALRAWGYVAHGAVAGTLGAAWACADEQWSVLGPEEQRVAVGRRPVMALRLPEVTVELLRQLGVERVEQLEGLPRDSLATRFGAGLVRRLDQALGEGDEWIVPFRPPPEFQVECCLEEPVERRECVEQIVERELETLGRLLRVRGVGALELRGRLDCSQGRVLRLRVGLFRPSACPRHWLSLLRMQWEREAWPGAVGRLGFQATATAALEERQQELFARVERGDERCLGSLLERLGSRLGGEAVLRPRLVNAAVPERAFGYEPALGADGRPAASRPLGASRRRIRSTTDRPTNIADSSASDTSRPASNTSRPASNTGRTVDSVDKLADTWRGTPRAGTLDEAESLGAAGFRPLELLPVPNGLEVVAAAPEGPPRKLFWEGRWWSVARFCGPERIETGWWRGDSIRRDYYRVETEDGARYWLFRDLTSGHWFLHGLFD